MRGGAPLEAKNIYGGTALGQALWSALNGDPGIDYVPIIEALLDRGAEIPPGSLGWVASKARIAEVLRRHGGTS